MEAQRGKMSTLPYSRLLEHTRVVAQRSALSRRRAWANYDLSVMFYYRLPLYVMLVVSLAILPLGLFSIWRAGPPPRSPHQSAIPLAAVTTAHQLNRSYIIHTVTDRDTLWGISMRYYGSGSPANIKLLRTANPWLPEDVGQLKIDSEMKIPVR